MEINIENLKFSFGLAQGGERLYGKNAKSWYPWVWIAAPKEKYIDHVLINKVAIFAGENEYSMLNRLTELNIWLADDDLSCTEEELIDIRNTGLIDRSLYINRFMYTDDKSVLVNIEKIYTKFFGIPINSKYKEIKLLFDISVQYTTGETITINQEFVAILKLKRRKPMLEDYFWIPTV